MDNNEAVEVFLALAQTTRLSVFRILVAREPEGIAAGEIAQMMQTPQNTMSSHLNALSRAGLICGERRGRSILYRANLARFREIASFLLKDCCGGRPEICGPLIADLSSCAASESCAHG